MNTANTRHTLYVHPGFNSCNVYWMPYPMRPGQHPRDLAQKYKDQWIVVSEVNHELKARWIHPSFVNLRDEFEGQCGGTVIEIDAIAPELQPGQLQSN